MTSDVIRGGHRFASRERVKPKSQGLGFDSIRKPGFRPLVAYVRQGVYEFGPWGHVAEWLRNGLQNRVHQFNSGRGLHQ